MNESALKPEAGPDRTGFPRILIISVNPVSTTSSNGKTYASIFKGYPKERLAQLYFRRETLSSDVCDRYFIISDEDILRRLAGRRGPLGREAHRGEQAEPAVATAVRDRLKNSSAARFFRSLVWRSIDIRSRELVGWLEAFAPDILFFHGGDANYLYDKASKIARETGADIIYYITDDYVLPAFSLNPFAQWNRLWTRSAFKRMCRASCLVATIGGRMAREYKERYGIESYPMMNMVPVDTREIAAADAGTKELVFAFAGGLHTRRWKTLGLIAASLERLEKEGLKGRLDVYSRDEPGAKILGTINRGDRSRFRGALDEAGVRAVLREADVLVHVESFAGKSRRVTRLSLSTKIPEYMAMGKCILAFGPKDVASIEYIGETGSGYIIDSTRERDIDRVLRDLMLHPRHREAFARQALKTARANHDEKIKRAEFHDLLLEWEKKGKTCSKARRS